MRAAKIPSRELDALRECILESEGQEVEVLVDGRHGGCPISVRLVGEGGISGLTASELASAVKRHFETQSERGRMRTQFFLVASHAVPDIFLVYRRSDPLLKMERATLEAPEQIMRIVKFLEEEQEADVQFLFGHDPYDPFKSAEFVLSKRVETGGRGMISLCSQKANPSLGFILGVGGEYLERILLDNPPASCGCAYVVEFVLEEENNTVYFRMYNNDQLFFSIKKDKLRGEK